MQKLERLKMYGLQSFYNSLNLAKTLRLRALSTKTSQILFSVKFFEDLIRFIWTVLSLSMHISYIYRVEHYFALFKKYNNIHVTFDLTLAFCTELRAEVAPWFRCFQNIVRLPQHLTRTETVFETNIFGYNLFFNTP